MPEPERYFVLEEPRSKALPGSGIEIKALDLDPEQALAMNRESEGKAVPCIGTSLIKPITAAAGNQPMVGAPQHDVWGLAEVGATGSPFDGRDVTVAVLDTGIDRDHPAFNGVTLELRDFTKDPHNPDLDSAPDDSRDGHGTHCAATIFGQDIGGTRIGVARGIKRALIGKILDSEGHGSSEQLYSALEWAIKENAHVISLSLTFSIGDEIEKLTDQGWELHTAASTALNGYIGNMRILDHLMDSSQGPRPNPLGCLIVAAAGNESKEFGGRRVFVETGLPGRAKYVLSVGALGRDDNGALRVAGFSNANPTIYAPGVDIVSAGKGGGLCSMSGTSMACPHVAGVAALWCDELLRKGFDPKVDRLRASVVGSEKVPDFAPDVRAWERKIGIVQAPS